MNKYLLISLLCGKIFVFYIKYSIILIIVGLIKVLSKRNTELFENSLRFKDLSENTVRDYTYRIKVFKNFIVRNGFNPNSFMEFKRFLAKENLSVSTKNKYFFAIKCLLKELYKQERISSDITVNVKSFKQSKKHKKDGLSLTDVEKIIEYCSNLSPRSETLRLKAILSLLIFQGLRQIEITRLDLSHIDLKNKIAFIQGKGCDDIEKIHLHPETVRLLKDYLKQYPVRSGPLFFSFSNNNNGKRLTEKSIREIIGRELKIIGIKKSIHGFRHFFTTRLLESHKGDILKVAKYTRHKSIEMLEIYNDAIIQKKELQHFYNTFNNLKMK